MSNDLAGIIENIKKYYLKYLFIISLTTITALIYSDKQIITPEYKAEVLIQVGLSDGLSFDNFESLQAQKMSFESIDVSRLNADDRFILIHSSAQTEEMAIANLEKFTSFILENHKLKYESSINETQKTIQYINDQLAIQQKIIHSSLVLKLVELKAILSNSSPSKLISDIKIINTTKLINKGLFISVGLVVGILLSIFILLFNAIFIQRNEI